MKRSFLALLPGLSGLGPSGSTEGNSDVVRPGGLAACGLKLGGFVTGEAGMPWRDGCKRSFGEHCFSLCFLALNYQDWGGRTKAKIVSCSAEKTFTLFLIPFCFLCCLWWFLCNLFPLWGHLGNFCLLPKGAAGSTRVSDTASCSLGMWCGGAWQHWVYGWLDDLKALSQPQLFCDSLI